MISFCTTIKNRFHQFERTFYGNAGLIEDNPDTNWFIVDFGSTDGFTEQIKRWLPLVSKRIIFARDLSGAPWHISYAKNVAHRVATGDILMSLDCDNFIGNEIIPMIHDKFGHGCKLVHHYAPICGSHGRVVIERNAFYGLGGYDETLHPMGHQDCDLMDRARAMGMRVETAAPTEVLAIPNTKSESIANCKQKNRNWFDYNRLNILISKHNIAAGRLVANTQKPWKRLSLEFNGGEK